MERENDTNLRNIAVQNVKVRARRWFTTRTAYTNANGEFRTGEFKRDVNYSIQWETPYAKISNWAGFGTSYNGPKTDREWNVNFAYPYEHWVRATLINAAERYRHQYHRWGIQNPYPISYWASGEAVNKLNIRAQFNVPGTGDMFPLRLNNIRIYADRTRDNRRKGTDELYRLTFHELAHQSHWKLTPFVMTNTHKIVRESWADYIEHLFTQAYYPDEFFDTSKQDFDRDDMDNGYTAVFIDLEDDNNQRAIRAGAMNFPDDAVIGYTPQQLQSSIVGATRLEHVREYLRSFFNNRTETGLNTLFEFYIDIQEDMPNQIGIDFF